MRLARKLISVYNVVNNTWPGNKRKLIFSQKRSARFNEDDDDISPNGLRRQGEGNALFFLKSNTKSMANHFPSSNTRIPLVSLRNMQPLVRKMRLNNQKKKKKNAYSIKKLINTHEDE